MPPSPTPVSFVCWLRTVLVPGFVDKVVGLSLDLLPTLRRQLQGVVTFSQVRQVNQMTSSRGKFTSQDGQTSVGDLVIIIKRFRQPAREPTICASLLRKVVRCRFRNTVLAMSLPPIACNRCSDSIS